jgi:hypothetical protein
MAVEDGGYYIWIGNKSDESYSGIEGAITVIRNRFGQTDMFNQKVVSWIAETLKNPQKYNALNSANGKEWAINNNSLTKIDTARLVAYDEASISESGHGPLKTKLVFPDISGGGSFAMSFENYLR